MPTWFVSCCFLSKLNLKADSDQKDKAEVAAAVLFPLTSPVLDLEDRRQLALGDLLGHLGGTFCLPVLAGHVKRRVPVLILQFQANPFVHQVLHHVGLV